MNTDRILVDYFVTHHSMDATRILERLKVEETAHFLKEIPHHLALALFKKLERHTAANCIERMENDQSAAIIQKLPLQVVSVILRQIDKNLQQAILALVSEEISAPLLRILEYPEDTAGAMVDPMVFTLPVDITIKEALQRMQKHPEKAIYYLYIVNRAQELTGVISMRELMSARPGEKLSEYMHTPVVCLSAGLNYHAILSHSGWQDYHALPVIEGTGILLGVVHYETLRRIEREIKKSRLPRQAIAASDALGELYQIGLSGLIRGAASPFTDGAGEK